MARHRFGDETSQTFHLRAPAFYAAASTKGIPLSVGHGDCMFHRHVAPRGRIGERPPRFVSESGHQFSASGVRLPVFGFGAGLTDQEARTPVPFLACGGRQVTSGWAPYRLGCTTAFTTLLFRPIPVRRNLCAWDCKVTPASCACQEGNTIGCIP